MAKRTLAERLEQVAQRKLRAEQHEARRKLMQRKERTRGLAELGALVARAGVDHLPPDALYACLHRIAREAANPETVAGWEREGADLIRKTEAGRVVAIARFPGKPMNGVAIDLRRVGFRWNRVLDQWEGRVAYEEAAELVAKAGGTISRAKEAA